jgi:hypothetical protein
MPDDPGHLGFIWDSLFSWLVGPFDGMAGMWSFMDEELLRKDY